MEGDQPPAGDARPLGRPPGRDYTPELGMRICERLMEGESLRAICRDGDMPAKGTVLRWLAADPDFALLYRQARQLGTELLMDELLDIADDGSNDFQDRERADGRIEAVFQPENVQRSRLRCDMRRWILARRQPGRYGDPRTVAEALALVPPAAGEEAAKPAPTITPQQRDAASRALAQRYNLVIEAKAG